MSPLLAAAATGYATAFSLILAIGAQNAFVLRQGLRREHVFAICLICALSDAILITAGVAGFGAIVAAVPIFPLLMRWAGALFLLAYGALRFFAAWKGGAAMETANGGTSLRAAVITCLALTWANPHVYLDTLGLIGAVSTQFLGPAKFVFGIAAVAASFTFFFGLGYGARLIAPMMRSETAWRVLDLAIGVLMWVLAWWLLDGAIRH